MSLQPVHSSVIRAVGYEGSTLGVLFYHNDELFLYHHVPESAYIGLLNADSPGAYYNRHIRGRYR